MTITPSEIRSRSFSRGLRGLKASEVEAFLEAVASQVEQLIDEREQLEARLEQAEQKLQNVRHVYEKIQERAADLDEREQRLKEEKQSIEEKRKATAREQTSVDAEKEKLMRVIARLQGALENELQILTDLRSGGQSVFDPEGTAVADSEEETDTEEKSTEELINSLFPKRLGPSNTHAGEKSQSTAGDDTSETSDEGAAAQQFDRIKQDIQEEEQETERRPSGASSAEKKETDANAADEDEEVSTEELDQIMGVFEDLDS